MTPARTHFPFLAALGLLLAGCASQPVALAEGPYAELSPREAALGEFTHSRVRWGGRIVQLLPQENRTCFEMIGARLDHYGRPWWGDETGGRFIACRPGFHEPTVFRNNREITFTGTITGYESRRIDPHDYRLARVEADSLHLWPEYARRLPTRPAPWPWWGYW